MRRPLIAAFILLGGVILCHAAGRSSLSTQATYRDEGRNPIPFSVSCSSTAWTVVQSSDSIRRSILMESDPENTLTVCLSTTTNSGDACQRGTKGARLTASMSLTDYTTVQWTCRAGTSATFSSSTVSGYITRDRGDYGAIGAPNFQ